MSVFSLIPDSPDPFSGEATFHRRILEALRAAGETVEERVVRGKDPTSRRDSAMGVLQSLPDGATLVVDSRVVPALVFALPMQRGRLRSVVSFHRAAHRGLEGEARQAAWAAERDTYQHVDRVLTSGLPGAMALGPLGVLPDQIGLILPAADPTPAALSPGTGVFLMVGRLEPRKHHVHVLDALAELGRGELRIAGSAAYSPAYAEQLEEEVHARGLRDRVSLLGALDSSELRGAYAGSDLFIAADPQEDAGFAALNAIAAGVPVLAAASGGLPRTLPKQGVLWSEPGSAAGIQAVLDRWLNDSDARTHLAREAASARQRVRRWSTAHREVVREVAIARALRS
ncbi:MAG: glycosyltransferase family 4 protein [Myxococcota bacterium]